MFHRPETASARPSPFDSDDWAAQYRKSVLKKERVDAPLERSIAKQAKAAKLAQLHSSAALGAFFDDENLVEGRR
jgi:hypothetical protein